MTIAPTASPVPTEPPAVLDVEASGFVQHLKLPHYVDFQSELVTVRALREEVERRNRGAALDQAAE